KAVSTELADKPLELVHVTPAPADGRIAFVTAKMLELNHYSKQPFDESVSSKFLDRYLEALDPQHMDFIAADLAEFEHYRTNLGRLTLTRRQAADTRPACEIFNRFMERLFQRSAYIDVFLIKGKFDLCPDDLVTLYRRGIS